jgi:integral membrane protein
MFTLLKSFKIIAILEGISYLVLFGNMLLVKPFNPEIYKVLLYPIGMTHGLLFIAYIILALLVGSKLKWSFKTLGIVMLASLVPLATFYIERKYLNRTA